MAAAAATSHPSAASLGQHHSVHHPHGAHTPHPPRTPHTTHTHSQMQNFSHHNYMMGPHQQMLSHHSTMIGQGYLPQATVTTYAQGHNPAHSASYMTSVIQPRMGGAGQQSGSQSTVPAASSHS